MPGITSPSLLSAAVTQAAVEATTKVYPSGYIIDHVLQLSEHLNKLADNSNMFGKTSADPFSASLSTLYNRLQDKKVGPSSLPSGFLTEERAHARIYTRVGEEAAQRPLADFEDLYYALVARMQELRQLLNLRIASGFNKASDAITVGGPTISDLLRNLSEYWRVLNDPACGKALDDAIRFAKVQAMRNEIALQVQKNGLSPVDAQHQLQELQDPKVYSGIVGLAYTPDWNPALVGAHLEEKYRGMLGHEKEEAVAKAMQKRRDEKPKSKSKTQTQSKNKITKSTTNKYDLVTKKKPTETTTTTTAHPEPHHGTIRRQYATLHSPSPIPRRHHNVHYEVASPNANDAQETAERTVQDYLDYRLEWQKRTQRVADYSNYLRARASPGARSQVQETLYGPVIGDLRNAGLESEGRRWADRVLEGVMEF